MQNEKELGLCNASMAVDNVSCKARPGIDFRGEKSNKTNDRLRNMAADSNEKNNLLTRGIGLIFLSVFGLSVLMPESIWGIHHLAFLPNRGAIIFLVLAAVILLVPVRVETLTIPRFFFGTWSVTVVATLFGFASYLWPIAYDVYGDAIKYSAQLGNIQRHFPKESLNDIINSDFSPDSARDLRLGLMALISWMFEWTGNQTFRVIDSVLERYSC